MTSIASRTTGTPAVPAAHQTSDPETEQLLELARIRSQFVPATEVTKISEENADPERFYRLGGCSYRFGDWIGSTPEADRPYSPPRRGPAVLRQATRSEGRWEFTHEAQKRLNRLYEEPEPDVDSPTQSIDAFQELVEHAVIDPLDGELTLEDVPAEAVRRPWLARVASDYEPLLGIDLRTGRHYKLVSFHTDRELTQARLGQELREFGNSTYYFGSKEQWGIDTGGYEHFARSIGKRDPESEWELRNIAEQSDVPILPNTRVVYELEPDSRWNTDLLINPGWRQSLWKPEPNGAESFITNSLYREAQYWNRRDQLLHSSDERAEAELKLLMERASEIAKKFILNPSA